MDAHQVVEGGGGINECCAGGITVFYWWLSVFLEVMQQGLPGLNPPCMLFCMCNLLHWSMLLFHNNQKSLWMILLCPSQINLKTIYFYRCF